MSSFFSIVTVTFNDDWALSKTLKSIFSQSCKNYELIVIDANSNDGTQSLVEFWQGQGLVDRYIREPDDGVYDAMNKGAKAARGDYLVYMNAGDVFASNEVLQKVYRLLHEHPCDAIMGWGELNGQLWAAWSATLAFRMASLGFCHQSLYVKREVCLKYPFDARPIKTDSDILQLANIIEKHKVYLHPETLAIRNGDVGISANTDKTEISILDTYCTYYPEISEKHGKEILAFRRRCASPATICHLLNCLEGQALQHLAVIVLDTLYQPQSKALSGAEISKIVELCVDVLEADKSFDHVKELQDLQRIQNQRAEIALSETQSKTLIGKEIGTLRIEAEKKFREHASAKKVDDYVVTLTSFPKRISSVHLVVESLFRQTKPPARIILNLGSDEFPNEKWLPSQLRKMQAQGLVINFVDRTAHQYDKFLHIYQENRSRPLVLVDDDVIYPPSSMEYLLKKHKKYPKLVVANRAHMMLFDKGGQLCPYADWDKEVHKELPDNDLFPTGAGGVLYPAGFFDAQLVCNKDLIMKFAPYADDIWLKVCSIEKGIQAVCSDMLDNERWYYRYTPQMSAGALHKTNVDLGLNDRQLQSTLKYFGLIPEPVTERLAEY